MKLKDIYVTFYKQCECQDMPDVSTATLRDLVESGTPICPTCDQEYIFDEEQEVWDTY